MSSSPKALPPAPDLREIDAQLVAEFSQLVRDVSTEIARDAVVPHLKQAMVDAREVSGQTVSRVEEKVRDLLAEDRQRMQEALQGPVQDIVAAYEGAQQTLASLASSSHLVDNLQLLAARLQEVRQATEELKRRRQEGERLLQEQARSLQEAIYALEHRIPDAARLMDEITQDRDALRQSAEGTGLLVAHARQLLTQLEGPAKEIQAAFETIRSIQDHLDTLHQHVNTLRNQVDSHATALKETVTQGLVAVVRQAEENQADLLTSISDEMNALKEMGSTVIRTVEETGERLSDRVDHCLQAHAQEWSGSLESLQAQLRELHDTTHQLRRQVSRNRLVLWFLFLLTGYLAVRPFLPFWPWFW